jgi:hypothetical protein
VWSDFGARMYYADLGRWFADDPKGYLRPHHSNYMAMGNNPILNIDPDGALHQTFIHSEIRAYKANVGFGYNRSHYVNEIIRFQNAFNLLYR